MRQVSPYLVFPVLGLRGVRFESYRNSGFKGSEIMGVGLGLSDQESSMGSF